MHTRGTIQHPKQKWTECVWDALVSMVFVAWQSGHGMDSRSGRAVIQMPREGDVRGDDRRAAGDDQYLKAPLGHPVTVVQHGGQRRV